MKKLALLIGIFILIAIAAIGLRIIIGGDEDTWVCRDGAWTKHGNPSSPQPTTQCLDSNTETFPTVATRSENIIVTSPVPNQEVGLPLKIEGQARVFENQFTYRVRDKSGTILYEGYASANSPDIGQFGNFSVDVNYAQPSSVMGMVEIFNYSAKDGSQENMVRIPVIFKNTKSTIVKVFFSNQNRNTNTQDCSLVYATDRRIPETEAVARAAINELLKGPSASEFDQGYRTNINSGVEIQNLSIENGLAKVDFNQQLQENVGGSCRVQAIRSQIAETLTQFTSVQDVVISIDGEAEGVLQP